MADHDKSILDDRWWPARAAAYRQRLTTVLQPRLRRARAGDPVPEFLFTYYNLRPGRLTCWHPGYGVVLAGDIAVRTYGNRGGYITENGGVTVSDAYLAGRAQTVRFVTRLLRATSRRPPQLNCFGHHEWAMVYRSKAVRHPSVPLRLPQPTVDAIVERTPLRCTHYDAFRFFTADFTTAFVPRYAPRRVTQADWEQPGCLHANMDLFKWCYKLIPLVDSELLLDCLELAATAREVDMRASPYDLREFGYPPIMVENPAGRAEYVRHQSDIAERAEPLRATLLARCELLIDVLDHKLPSQPAR